MASQNILEMQRLLVLVLDVGVGTLRKQELLLLLGRKRLTPSVWVEVNNLWLEVGDGTPLFVGEAEGVWAFAYGRGMKASKDAWFQDVRQHAELPID